MKDEAAAWRKTLAFLRPFQGAQLDIRQLALIMAELGPPTSDRQPHRRLLLPLLPTTTVVVIMITMMIMMMIIIIIWSTIIWWIVSSNNDSKWKRFCAKVYFSGNNIGV